MWQLNTFKTKNDIIVASGYQIWKLREKSLLLLTKNVAQRYQFYSRNEIILKFVIINWRKRKCMRYAYNASH